MASKEPLKFTYPSEDELKKIKDAGLTQKAKIVALNSKLKPDPAAYINQQINEAVEKEEFEFEAKLRDIAKTNP